MYIAITVVTKLALLVFYRRVNPDIRFHYSIYGLALVLIISFIVFSCLILFDYRCKPSTGNGICLGNISIAQAVINLFADLVLILMPIPTILALEAPLRQKITIYGILALGSGYG